MTTTYESAVDVNVPVRTAYNQWTQFETFPEFMEGVEEVKQLNDTTIHWKAEIGGQEREWTSSITEQTPDQRIAWRSSGEINNAGVVTFHRLSDDKTRVMLQFEFEPEGFTDHVGDKLGIIQHRVKGDMERFKEFIEARGVESGAWRGTVNSGTPTT